MSGSSNSKRLLRKHLKASSLTDTSSKGKGNRESENPSTISKADENSHGIISEITSKEKKEANSGRVIKKQKKIELKPEDENQGEESSFDLEEEGLTFPSFTDLHTPIDPTSSTEEMSEQEDGEIPDQESDGPWLPSSPPRLHEGDDGEITEDEIEKSRKRKALQDAMLLQVLHENPSLLSRELKEAHLAKLKNSRSDVSDVDLEERKNDDVINSHNSMPTSALSSYEPTTLTGTNLADNEVIVNKALLDALTTLTSSLRSNTSASTVVMSDKNLPNTHLTMPSTTVKVENYIDAVKKLLNSSVSLKKIGMLLTTS